MQYRPIIKNGVMIFNLVKPIYGSFFGIWDKWLKIAKKEGLKLVVKTEYGIATFVSVDEYLKDAKRLKRYYKNPNEPMIFWGRYFKPDADLRVKRKKMERKLGDFRIPFDTKVHLLMKIKKNNPELAVKLGLR